MKTNQSMVRKMGDFNITQRTSDGYFDANELLNQWNSKDGNTRRRMDKFLQIDGLAEFINALTDEVSHGPIMTNADFQAIKEIKGRMTKNGKTKDQIWMHPYIFIKFSMWINPRFEVKVIKFVYDEMIKYRNDAGDAYKDLSSAVARIVPKSFMPVAMQQISEALNYVIFGNHERNIRNKFGEEDKQKDLYMLEKKIADLISDGFIKRFEDLINYLRVQYQRRNYPQIFLS